MQGLVDHRRKRKFLLVTGMGMGEFKQRCDDSNVYALPAVGDGRGGGRRPTSRQGSLSLLFLGRAWSTVAQQDFLP